jgi:hypothetical protein
MEVTVVSKKPKGFKIPKKMGEAADLLYTIRANRLDLEKQAAELKAQEGLLKQHFIDRLGKDQAAEGVVGSLCTVRVLSDVFPIVTDWDAVYEYIKKNGEFDLMQRRLNDKAVKDRWENGQSVPGTDKMMGQKVSVTKR